MGTAYNPAAWSTFFSAQVSASAALAGLIFVAVSINLRQITGQNILVARSAKALFSLTGVLVASTLCLVPNQREALLGLELTAVGLLLWIAATRTQWVASHGNPYIDRRQMIFGFVLTQLSALPYVAAGVSLIADAGGGLYWLVAGVVFSLLTALMDAWVLLIEIQR